MIILPNITQTLEVNFEFYRTLSGNYKSQVNSLITNTIQGFNKHKHIKRSIHIGSCSLWSKDLRKRFNEYGMDYTKVIPHFFDTIDDEYDKKNKVTKYYKLKDSVIDCLIHNLKTTQTFLKNSETGKSIHNLSDNGVRQTYIDKNGISQRCSTTIKINTWVKGNEEVIDKYISDLEQNRDKVNILLKPRIEKYLLELCSLKSLLNNNLKNGYIPQIYKQSTGGRLTGKGFHLLNIKKKLRFIFFSEMGLYDYDISNCHYSIFSNLSRQNGFITEGIDYYLKNKSKVRETLSEDLELTIKQVKEGLISLIYGNSIIRGNISTTNSLYEKFRSVDVIRQFSEHKIIKRLISDIKKGTKLIINTTPVTKKNRYGERIINVIGSSQNIYNEKGRLIEERKRLHHILTGWEVKLIEFINSVIGDKMISLSYDGWVGEEIDTDYIEKKLSEEFDFDIKISTEQIVSPTLSDLGFNIH
jgi:hypothetical protein